MNLYEILTDGGSLFLILMTIVQVSPVEINPWSWLAKIVAKAMGLNAIEAKLDAHVTMDDRRAADGHRARILHFNNELLRDIDHTKEEFTEVLTEIDAYEKYCQEHPEYPNNRAVLAIGNIREVYKERLKLHDFLEESSAARREQAP